MDKNQERLIQRTMDVQRELTRSGLDRRNLLRLGVLSAGTGMLLPISGLSMRAAYGASTPVCPIPGVDMISPRTTPFKDPFQRLYEITPTVSVENLPGGSVAGLTDSLFLRGGKPTAAPTNALDSKLRLLREHPELANARRTPILPTRVGTARTRTPACLPRRGISTKFAKCSTSMSGTVKCPQVRPGSSPGALRRATSPAALPAGRGTSPACRGRCCAKGMAART